MNLRSLSNQELNQSFKAYAQKEREVLRDILLHVTEVDRRHMYLDFGFGSLFEYMTTELRYANGCAQRRIDAARLSYDVPGLISSIQSGEMNLSQVTLIQMAVRQVTEQSHSSVSAELKNEVVNEIIGKSVKESQVIIAQSLGIQIKETPKIQHQADESVRLEVTLSKDQWEKLEEVRALLSHSLPHGSWDQVFEYLADKVIQQKNKISSRSQRKMANITSAAQVEEIEAKGRTNIPAATQRELYKKQDCCQFKDKTVGRKCGSKWQLQTDHIKPIWAGGDNSLENLQRLCGKHNRRRYQQQAGIRNL